MDQRKIKRALVSVSDKSGLKELCETLSKFDIELISTGGTFKFIKDAGFKVQPIESLTDFPEMLDGRVKTLHPKVHGGVLADRTKDAHLAALKEHGISEIDLVVVNLYPFKNAVLNKDNSEQQIIENIDIGGPTMIRSAAKNHAGVAVLCDTDYYPTFIEELTKNSGSLGIDFRKDLARRAFVHTANYDSMIAAWFNDNQNEKFPGKISFTYSKHQTLRYGENPHQAAAYYTEEFQPPKFEILQGKEMSYNNYLDLTAALESVISLGKPGVSIIKHTNPCGIAVNNNLLTAFQQARQCDPVSAFGGIIAIAGSVDQDLASEITQNFVEIVVAESYSEEARKVFTEKKNLRLIETSAFSDWQWPHVMARPVYGGILVQDPDTIQLADSSSFEIKTKIKPTAEDLEGLLFAWRVAMNVKSNSIVFTDHNRSLAIGAGQMSRVDSVEIAISKADKAGLDLKGSFLASDAFFPFRDSIDRAHEIGVKAIVQPGGSIRDDDVIAACDELGIAMVFTGIRHFRH